MKTWVIMNDLQIPFHDPKALGVVVDCVRDLKPHGIVLNGDVVDCYTISKFSKNPLRQGTLNQEIKLANQLLRRLAPVTTERWWLGGNHEDRLRKYIWDKAPELATEVNFPKLFHIEDEGFRWKDYGGSLRLGNLLVTHGSMVNKHSGWTARSHLEKYGTSILIGHTHRLGAFFKRDYKGIHGAWENGCLCLLSPEYDQFPNWQQGFSVVTVGTNGIFSVQQLPVISRTIVQFGMKQYKERRPLEYS